MRGPPAGVILDRQERDAISSRLMRYRDQIGQDWADIIDFLTLSPERCPRKPAARGAIARGDRGRRTSSRRSRIEGGWR
jgi:hypothetical protein